MSPDLPLRGLEIGPALKDARRRVGMDVKEAEERTKIRAKYLRALEAEDWEVLPAPAYVRAFLRTYGELLGLDGQMLADEFRRRYEEPSAAAASPASEPVLQGRRRANGSRGSEPGSRGTLIAGIAAVIVILLVVLSLLGRGDDEPADVSQGPRDGGAKAEGKKDGGGDSSKEAREPIDLKLEALGTVQVCLASKNEAMIDGQVLAEGATEEFSGQKRYRIDLPAGGALKVEAGGSSEKLTADGEASWEANSNGISSIDYAGPDCP